MKCQGGVDIDSLADSNGAVTGSETWMRVLVHRPPEQRIEIGDRLAAAGVDPLFLERVLGDDGDALFSAAGAGRGGWADPFGGELAVASVLTELQAHAAAVLERAATLRGQVYAELLRHHSLAEIARAQGISRQAVHRAGRTSSSPTGQPAVLRPRDWQCRPGDDVEETS